LSTFLYTQVSLSRKKGYQAKKINTKPGGHIDMQTVTVHQKRQIHLDYLRFFLVMLVVFEHASKAYCGSAWWPVCQAEKSTAAWWVGALSDAFAMPHLFFIAGYFALPSLNRRGAGSFIKRKLTRLGIPWLVCILTICPILPLVYHYTRGGLAPGWSYWELWLRLMANAADFDFRLYGSMEHLMQANQFYQRYMWFISVLLSFFLLLAAIWAFKPGWCGEKPASKNPKGFIRRSGMRFTLLVGLMSLLPSLGVIAAMQFMSGGLSNPEPLFSLGNIIQFRPSRFFLYTVYFGLGMAACQGRWLSRGRIFTAPRNWAAPFWILLALLATALWRLKGATPETTEIMGPLYFVAMNFFCAAALGFFFVAGQ
jgi:glucan biosynthesis protein C